MNFYEAFHFLRDHPIFLARGRCVSEHCKLDEDIKEVFGLKDIDTIDTRFSRFHEALEIEVVKVNPQTNSIEDDDSKNTATRVWLEAGPVEEDDSDYGQLSHDIRLDCGGKTFEEAIVKLAGLVRKYYGRGE